MKILAARRLATVVLILLASTLTAQNASTSRIAISVIDQSGAVIPGAHIVITSLRDADTRQYEADASGNATAGLVKGSYTIVITASGFQQYSQKLEIRGEPNEAIRATLPIGRGVSGPCEPCAETEVPLELERKSSDIFIPLEPLQTITLINVRFPPVTTRF